MRSRPDLRLDLDPGSREDRSETVALLPLVVLVAALFFAVAAAGAYLSRQPGSIATLWYANAVAVAALAGRPPRDWPALLAGVGGANLAVNLLAGDGLPVAASFLPANLGEILLAGTLLRWFCRPSHLISRPDRLLKTLLLGGVVPILAGASLGASLLVLQGLGSFGEIWLSWALGSGIGSISLLPLGLLVAARGWRPVFKALVQPLAMGPMLGALAVALWATTSLPYPFVYISTALALVAWIGRFAAAALGGLLCSVAVGTVIALGIFQPPPSVGPLDHLLFYLPLILALVPPLVLAASLETIHQQVDRLSAEQNLMEITLRSIGEGVVTTDPDGRITYLNPIAQELLGVSLYAVKGHDFAETVRLFEPVAGTALTDPIRLCLAGQRRLGPPQFAMLRNRLGQDFAVQLSVAPIFGGDDGLLGAVMVFRDETEARALAERTAFLAHHDSLTGLPNRVLFQDRLLQACQQGQRNRSRFAVVFMDLDHFKHVNDSLGHATGDELLKAMARRLSGLLRLSDTVCRLGGDEFVVLLSVLAHGEDAAQVAGKILREVARPCVVEGAEFNVSATLGISIFPEDGDDPDTLMKHADAAMYRAKREGRNRFQFFSRLVDEAAVARLQLEADMRRGLLNGQFRVFYQPIVDGVDRRAIGVEALARWILSGRELHSPEVFIPVAEETRLILPLGVFVLRQACMQLRSWEGTALSGLTMAVNISAIQLADPAFVEVVTEILRSTGVAGHRLVFEITESILMGDPERAAGVLARLRRLGIRIAIDDFGTGYANLSYLKQFPVDCIKIDRSFVRDLDQDGADRELVKAIVAMARNLGLKVIAEGVETPAQAAILAELHCPAMQGFLFARPADSGTTRRWLDDYVGRAVAL